MPRLTPPSERDQIVAAVVAAPQGLSVQDLLAAGLVRGERRTVQRRLQALVTEGRLTAEGPGTATRYVTAAEASTSVRGRADADAFSMIRAPHEVYVPLSEAAIALREWVQQPPRATNRDRAHRPRAVGSAGNDPPLTRAEQRASRRCGSLCAPSLAGIEDSQSRQCGPLRHATDRI